MKRILSTLFFLLLVVASFAQNNGDHLKFMGIPLTGNITQFQPKLIAKGCTLDKISSANASTDYASLMDHLQAIKLRLLFSTILRIKSFTEQKRFWMVFLRIGLNRNITKSNRCFHKNMVLIIWKHPRMKAERLVHFHL